MARACTSESQGAGRKRSSTSAAPEKTLAGAASVRSAGGVASRPMRWSASAVSFSG